VSNLLYPDASRRTATVLAIRNVRRRGERHERYATLARGCALVIDPRRRSRRLRSRSEKTARRRELIEKAGRTPQPPKWWSSRSATCARPALAHVDKETSMGARRSSG